MTGQAPRVPGPIVGPIPRAHALPSQAGGREYVELGEAVIQEGGKA
jgi:hypothetical protein